MITMSNEYLHFHTSIASTSLLQVLIERHVAMYMAGLRGGGRLHLSH